MKHDYHSEEQRNIRAERRICDALVILECIEDVDVPEKYREKFSDIYDDLLELWEDMSKDLYDDDSIY